MEPSRCGNHAAARPRRCAAALGEGLQVFLRGHQTENLADACRPPLRALCFVILRHAPRDVQLRRLVRMHRRNAPHSGARNSGLDLLGLVVHALGVAVVLDVPHHESGHQASQGDVRGGCALGRRIVAPEWGRARKGYLATRAERGRRVASRLCRVGACGVCAPGARGLFHQGRRGEYTDRAAGVARGPHYGDRRRIAGGC
mmetsp:Transcript_45963/g.147770  ORF Transcript_45963/g.147770 Transcript_45963/m.147770 type:complete len:201 (-) Transcript_45963:1394-1996(-)